MKRFEGYLNIGKKEFEMKNVLDILILLNSTSRSTQMSKPFEINCYQIKVLFHRNSMSRKHLQFALTT